MCETVIAPHGAVALTAWPHLRGLHMCPQSLESLLPGQQDFAEVEGGVKQQALVRYCKDDEGQSPVEVPDHTGHLPERSTVKGWRRRSPGTTQKPASGFTHPVKHLCWTQIAFFLFRPISGLTDP